MDMNAVQVIETPIKVKYIRKRTPVSRVKDAHVFTKVSGMSHCKGRCAPGVLRVSCSSNTKAETHRSAQLLSEFGPSLAELLI